MKRSLFFRVLVLGVVIAISAVGCKKTPKNPTPIPEARVNVGGEGPVGPKGPNDKGQPIPPETPPTVSEKAGKGQDDDLPLREGFDNYNDNRDAFKAQTVYFNLDSSVVNVSEQGKLAAVADALKANPKNKLRLEGHCDERGTEGYNLALGERRALALRESMGRLGISGDRIQTKSLGEMQPAVPGHDESAWKINRRGEFILLTPR